MLNDDERDMLVLLYLVDGLTGVVGGGVVVRVTQKLIKNIRTTQQH